MRASPPSLVPGVRVGSYDLVRLLGEGSMGQVFEARHVRLGRRVALKLLREDHARDPALVQRFFQEARAVNRVDHPNLIGVQDFVEETDGNDRPRAWCVMELLEGQTLAEVMQEGPLPLRRALGLVEQVCRGLAAAHAAGIVHRDLKPENVFVSPTPDGGDLVKVLDFGVAKLLEPDPAISLRQTFEGAVVGTPLYMAPEQAAGLPVDTRADVYGVGCLLYELITGRSPYTANDLGTLLSRILTQEPEPIGERSAAGERVPQALEDLVRACLEKQVEARPASIEGVAERLHAISQAMALGLTGGEDDEAPNWRTRTVAAVCALVVVAALGLMTGRATASESGSGQEAATADAIGVVPAVALTSPDEEEREVGFSAEEANAAEATNAEEGAALVHAAGVDATAAASDSRSNDKGVVQRSRKSRASGAGGVRRTSSSVGVSRDAVLDPFHR